MDETGISIAEVILTSLITSAPLIALASYFIRESFKNKLNKKLEEHKSELNKKLEDYKSKLKMKSESKIHVSKEMFNLELKAYKEMWECITDILNNLSIPALDQIETINKCSDHVFRNRPFISNEILTEYRIVQDLARKYVDDMMFKIETEVSKEKIAKFGKLSRSLSDSIKNRLGSLSIID